MSSINFNSAATQALRTLQSSNAQLDATQKRISTGLKIGEAKDNAAYWSISTTLKSDNKALSTVKDALSLGAATVDTAYEALNATIDVLDEIKSKLTAATQDNVDKKAVQSEINELKKQLKAIATAATFSGENWLSINSSETGYTGEKTIVSSFNRTEGSVSLDTITIDTTKTALIDSAAGKAGLLESSTVSADVTTLATAITGVTEAAGNDGTGTPATGATGGSATISFAGSLTIAADDRLNLSIKVNTGDAVVLVIDQKLVNSALPGVTGGKIADEAAMKLVIEKALDNKNISDVTVTTGSDTVILTGDPTSAALKGTIAVSATATAVENVLDMDITNLSRSEIESFIATVVAKTDAITSASATLGAVSKRVDLQKTFVSTLMDTIDKGVSGLVDADMNEESTKLQALQVKQQLGVQALSIANQSAQNVLRLFQ